MQLIPIDSSTLWAIPNAIAHIGDTLPDQFRAIAHAAGPIVVTALWQGAAVAAGPLDLSSPRPAHLRLAPLRSLDGWFLSACLPSDSAFALPVNG